MAEPRRPFRLSLQAKVMAVVVTVLVALPVVTLLIVDGRLQQRRWETEDGQKRSKHEVVAQSVTFLPKRAEAGMEGGHSHEEPAYEDEPFSSS